MSNFTAEKRLGYIEDINENVPGYGITIIKLTQ